MESAGAAEGPKKLFLDSAHRAQGAVMTDFGGWDLPERFSSIRLEHEAVRSQAALFDISHMGQVSLKGPGAVGLLESWISTEMANLKINRCRYTLALSSKGEVMDDLIVYRISEQEFFLVLNAATEEGHLETLHHLSKSDCEVIDLHPDRVKLDLQGPWAPKVLSQLISPKILDLKYFMFGIFPWLGTEVLVSRTGYTGEVGYELYIPRKAAKEAWQALSSDTGGLKPTPAGLGARETLRMEVAYALSGHELGPGIMVEEAGMMGRVTLGGQNIFPGKEALLQRKGSQPDKSLIGFMLEKGIPRPGCSLVLDGKEVGKVTSGTFSPSLKKGIGLGYVQGPAPQAGTRIDCVIRGRNVESKVAELPFYTKGTARMRINEEGNLVPRKK